MTRMTKGLKLIQVICLLAVASLFSVGFSSGAASAKSLCSDGWVSGSSGSGTCSWHGGIAGGVGYLPGTYTVYKMPTDFRVRKYANCTSLRSQFVFGVSNRIVYSTVYYTPFYFANLYTKNKALDTNKDGAICEVRKIYPTVTTPIVTPSPTPTPTPTPVVKLGMRTRPATPGQTVETAGFEFTLLGSPVEASAVVCSYKVVVAVQGCTYANNSWGNIDHPTGVDGTSPRTWKAVNLRVKRLGSSLYYYPLSSWRFALYSSVDTSYWVSAYAPNITASDLAPYASGESREVTLYISVPKTADLTKTVFGILDFVESAYIESQSRYFFPIY